MSWTKKTLAELTVSIIEGGKVTSQKIPDLREVYVVIEGAVPQLIHADIKENMEVDGRFFSPALTLSVLTDTARNKKYTTLPTNPILSPQGNALILINPIQNDSDQFLMATLAESWLTKGLEVGDLKVTSFHLENKTVFYENIPPQYTQVLVRMVSSIADLGEDTVIPLPDHLQPLLLQMVLQVFGIQQQAIDKTEIQA